MTDRELHYGAWPYVLLLLLAAVWGSSFILMKVGLFGWTGEGGAVMNGLQLGMLRIALAGVVMWPIAWRHCAWFESFDLGGIGDQWFYRQLLPAVLFAVSQERLPSAVAGMLNALSPLWTLVLAVGLYGTVVRRKQVVGLMLGFAGALGLMSLKDASGEVHWGSAGMLVLATACYGWSINVVRNRLGALPAVAISALGFVHDRHSRGRGVLAVRWPCCFGFAS